jgi:hypothetical protein
LYFLVHASAIYQLVSTPGFLLLLLLL